MLKKILSTFRSTHSSLGQHREQAGASLDFHIDEFIVFAGMIKVSGWFWDASRSLSALSLVVEGEAALPVDIGLPSADVAATIAAAAHHARFEGRCFCGAPANRIVQAKLRAVFDDGSEFTVDNLGARGLGGDQSMTAGPRFFEKLKNMEAGTLLEVGSRARSGVVRRQLTPPGWHYTGLDILPGDNVDVVGDAHRLSAMFPAQTFSAVMAMSVLEHLLMPWKFIVELNRVMKPGGVGLFTTHQCWPMHDRPWDFWRFSSDAWAAIFNRATGFEIIEAHMGEPAFVVARNCHAITNFAGQPSGFLASTVLFRKIGETSLRWEVDIDDVLTEGYPRGTVARPE